MLVVLQYHLFFILRYRLELWGQISKTYKFKGTKYEHISREKERDKIVFYCQVYDSQKENYLEKDERNKNYVGLMFTANNYQLPAYVSCVT